MTLRLTFGIDPGLSGAIATLIDGEPGPFLDMPTRMVGKWNEVAADLLSQFIREQRRQHVGAYVGACLEHVGARPGDGGTSAFRFGEGYGQVKAVLAVHGIGYTRVVPAVWKRHYGLIGQDKDAARLLAIRRFPGVERELARKKDHGRGDALLLALYHDNIESHARAA